MVVFVGVVLALDEDARIFMDFNWIDWGCLVGCAFFNVQSSVFNFKASQHLPLPARLPLSVTGVLFQIVIDVILFNISFNAVQIVLIFGIVSVKAYELCKFFLL